MLSSRPIGFIATPAIAIPFGSFFLTTAIVPYINPTMETGNPRNGIIQANRDTIPSIIDTIAMPYHPLSRDYAPSSMPQQTISPCIHALYSRYD